MIIDLVGILALLCLAGCAIPQVIKTIRDGNSDGLSLAYIILLECGFILMVTYVLLTKPLIPVIVNYIINIIMVGILIKYKLFPRRKKC